MSVIKERTERLKKTIEHLSIVFIVSNPSFNYCLFREHSTLKLDARLCTMEVERSHCVIVIQIMKKAAERGKEKLRQ